MKIYEWRNLMYGYAVSVAILLMNLFFGLPGGILAGICLLYIGAGDWLSRIRMGAQLQAFCGKSSQAKAEKAFETVRQKALRHSPLFQGVRLYYVDSNQINAYCLGWNSVAITSGCTRLDSKTLEAILAHELGHISNGDTVLNRVLFLECFGILALLSIYQVGFLLALLVILAIFSFSGFFGGFLACGLLTGLKRLGDLLRHGALSGMQAVIRAIGRRGERQADGFAVKLGYGGPLKSFLKRFSQPSSRTLGEVLYSTHPSNQERIHNIEVMEGQSHSGDSL